MSISTRDRKLLWGRSGNRCAFPGCQVALTLDATGGGAYPLGPEAHIVAQEAHGPRANPELSDKERDGYANLILLCPNHHKVIDEVLNLDTYTVDALLRMKAEHEQWVNEQLEREKKRAWRMPHLRNPNFTGREELLAQVRGSLTSGKPAALTQALAGLGGIGKTQLAIEYAYRHAGEYEVVWWIRSEEPTQLASDYASLAAALGLPEKNEQDQRVIIAAVRGWLEHSKQWLLVFDNVPHPDAIVPQADGTRDYLPHGGAGHILITSRDQNWKGVATPVAVPKLPRAESIAFIEKWLGHPDSLAGEVAHELGDFPLALAQAAAYIENTGTALSDYLPLFRSRRTELWQQEHSPLDYRKTVATTWSMAMTQLQQEDPAALDLLRLCAYLAPDDIPISMLREQAGKLPEPLSAVMPDQLALNHTLAALRRYSLVEVAEDSLSLHRLLQAVVRDGMKEEERRKWIEAAAETVNAAFPQEADDVRTWPTCARLMPHGLTVSDWAEPAGLAPRAVGRILNHIATYLLGRAEFVTARGLLERALNLDERTHGPEHPEVAVSLHNLGLLLNNLGDLEGAKARYERALAINEEVFGPDHPRVAENANNLGNVLRDLGDLEGAKAHFERVLTIFKKAYGPDHPNVAIGDNNLGYVLWAMKDMEGAKVRFDRVLTIFEKAYGPDHPNVATCVNNLGRVLQDMGDLEGAKVHFERAVAIDERAYGPDHPEVATDLHNLGCLHAELGHTAKARDLLTRALGIFERFLGKDHPNTVNTRGLLAKL